MEVFDKDLLDARQVFQQEVAKTLVLGQKKSKREDPRAKKSWYRNTSRHKIVARAVWNYVNRLSQLIPVEFLSGSLCSVLSLSISIVCGIAALVVGFIHWDTECEHGDLTNWVIIAGLFHLASGWLALMRWFISSSILTSFLVDKLRQSVHAEIGDEESEGVAPTQYVFDDGLSDRTPAEKQQEMFNNFAWYFDIAIFFMSIALIAWYIVGIVWVARNWDYDEQSGCDEALYITALLLVGIFLIKAVLIVPWVLGWCGFCWFTGCFCFWETTILRCPFWTRSFIKALYSLGKTLCFCTCCPRDGEATFNTYCLDLNPVTPAPCISIANVCTMPFALCAKVNSRLDMAEDNLSKQYQSLLHGGGGGGGGEYSSDDEVPEKYHEEMEEIDIGGDTESRDISSALPSESDSDDEQTSSQSESSSTEESSSE